ncbi:MAG: protein translocase subunit SecF [Sphingomonadaceae bacterium]|uniref:protein translocase subunit SecF n=1 Tax=Thermaurantiacus sp. TaxID=2820283 RepID=UPI00298F11E1|nr:protein translocase subunit SecF [Thermaurantiacus sp.]MCS6986390.1 protein translocase subunit SecF [Sphingomonadaceae bacterium]MDW8414348.1 protein translocase subunit SecF [Thermaurantiacus sp.]
MRLLKLVPDGTNIPFMRVRNLGFALALAFTLAGILLVAVRGLNFGVDFAGGLMIEARFARPVPLDRLRAEVNGLGFGPGSLQAFGDPRTVAIRLPLPKGDEEAVQRMVKSVQRALVDRYPGVEFRRVETVSGKVSGELIRQAALAVLFAMVGIAIYIWFRFEWQFGVGALVALVHDVAVTLGLFALFRWEFNLSIIAAVLTIVGYSLNDTIVVYDRIRENLRKHRKMDMIPLLDLSLNETLSRTIVTSLTMVIALAALVLFGGQVLFGFSIAMLIGVVVGTFSSLYIGAPILLWLGVGPHSFVPADAPRAQRP